MLLQEAERFFSTRLLHPKYSVHFIVFSICFQKNVNLTYRNQTAEKENTMMKKILVAIMIGTISIFSLTGCYTTGQATGEVAEEVEEGAEAFEEGYEEGTD